MRFELKLKCSYAIGNLFLVRAKVDAHGSWDLSEAERLPGQYMNPCDSCIIKDAIGSGDHWVVIALVDGEGSRKVLHQFFFLS